MLSRQTQIWNRAALESGGPTPAEGDSALASLLLAHGLVMNGGVVHALEAMSQTERVAAIAGFKYFGLSSAAEVLTQVHDGTEETEEILNAAYWRAVPNDETLAHAFRVKLLAYPEAFAPTASGARA